MQAVLAVLVLSVWASALTETRTPRHRRSATAEEGSESGTTADACLARQVRVLDSRLLEQNDLLDTRLGEQNAALDSLLQAQNTALDARFYEQRVALDTLQRQNQALDEHLVKLSPMLDGRLLELVTLMDTRLQALHSDTVDILDRRLQEQSKALDTRFLEQKAAFDSLQILHSALDSRLMEVETAVNTRLLALSADVLRLADILSAHKVELDACLQAKDTVLDQLRNSPKGESTAMDYRVHAVDEELGSVKRTLAEHSRQITSLRNLTSTQAADIASLGQGLPGLNATLTELPQDHGHAEQPVAFTARFSSESVTGLVQGQTLKFDDVLHNIGSGYNLTTGLFTAPASGTYVFYVQVMRHRDDGAVQADVHQGDRLLARAAGCCSTYGTGSAMLTHDLQQGDTVHVRVNSGSSLFGGMYTSFSGFQLSPV